MQLEICTFAKRQYSKSFHGTQVTPTIVASLIALMQNPYALVPGYAPFCKIYTLSNVDSSGAVRFPDIKSNVISRSEAVKRGARYHTAYEARTEAELPVLVEWVCGVEKPTARFIHLVVYSKVQLAKEGDQIEADWGIVLISGSESAELEPMKPITAMRNSLGVTEGGSDVPLDQESYRRSVEFWSRYVAIR